MTQWTKEQYEQLSRNLSSKFDLSPEVYNAVFVGEPEHVWLHDDWNEIMEMCVNHGVEAVHDYEMTIEYADSEIFKFAAARVSEIGIVTEHKEYYSDHNNDKSLTERVARMLALMEVQL